ncbi:MAG: VWA domain-containing protein, partial [Planctomycetaceae bacterium]|nr:VWA domain-containing protein [Planctomycetaceae bacterium]
WEGGRITPHQAAVRKATQILEELNAGDTVGLIDARDQVRTVIESPSRDFAFVREELDKLPPPSGSSNLPAAINRAMNILSATTNPSREIIVLTDGQALGWKADDENLWARIEDLRKQVPFPPRLWIWDVTKTEGADNIPAASRVNFSVDRVSLSRELTVPDFPIRLKTKVQYHANLSPDAPGDPPQEVTRKVYLEVDGQRLREKQQTVLLKPDGEASVEFEYRFSSPGSRVLAVVLDDDNLPGDNRAEVAVTVADAIPVLMVDGNPSLDKTKTETFFLQAALSPSLLENPLVKATVVPWTDFQPGQLEGQDVVILADVPQLTGQQVLALKTFVAKGGGLLVTLGDGVKAVAYNADLYENGKGLLPAKLDQIEIPPAGQQSVNVVDASLELPWLMPFRRSNDGQFYTVRFEKWWQVTPASEVEKTDEEVELTTPIVAAQLEGSDPLLVTRKYGQGNVMLFATPMDAGSQWNTLGVRQHTFVPLIYEMVFHLATPGVSHNVETGMPLIVEVPTDLKFEDYLFKTPDDSERPATRQATEEDRVFARLNETELPGVYTFRHKTQPPPAGAHPPEQFVANFDRAESDLTPLTEEQQKLLTTDNQTAFITSVNNLMENLVDDSQRAELFRYLMILFLAILVFEVVMTRRMVQGGHMDLPLDGEEHSEETEEFQERQPLAR